MSAVAKLLGVSEKLNVIVEVSPNFMLVSLRVIASVGAVVSPVTVKLVVAALVLPAGSVPVTLN